ncbi:hypothetical protein AB0D08_32755 [Kitasatospora sp. NPDC048540]|uniref:hypothetical protein n=1 Tax=Kitasatospora sp. NPDC048540 TaxID=3155634 RepID=UPI003400B7E5
MSDTFIPTSPVTGLPVGTVAVFLTQSAALVALFAADGPDTHYRPGSNFRWSCLGCGESNGPTATLRTPARNGANTHATECRAIPWHPTTA